MVGPREKVAWRLLVLFVCGFCVFTWNAARPKGLWRRYAPKFVGLQRWRGKLSELVNVLAKNWCPGGPDHVCAGLPPWSKIHTMSYTLYVKDIRGDKCPLCPIEQRKQGSGQSQEWLDVFPLS